MASVFQRYDVWFVKWKDGAGQWKSQRTTCQTKAEAKRFARDLETKAERQRAGLEALPEASRFKTFGDLLDWWLAEYGAKLRSQTILLSAEKHFRPTLGSLPIQEVTAGRIEALLNERTADLSPATLNHLRALLHRIYSRAIRCELWQGTNPAAGVQRRKIPKRLPEYLRAEEVPAVLDALDPCWRAMFATAVYTGVRKGELLGLRKRDVDLGGGFVEVSRSYDSDTTKGARAALVPIAEGLRPYLVAALQEGKGDLLFARPDGTMHRQDLALDRVLRRAMGRAGIVTGYRHACRRQGCGFVEVRKTADADRCPQCSFRLWPSAISRHVRWHDLRHTTATLLLKAGVPLATVQKVLRHSDPAITSEIYGHLDLEDMRAAVNRLPFATPEPLPVPLAKAANFAPEIRTKGAPSGVVSELSRAKRSKDSPSRPLGMSNGGEAVTRAERASDGFPLIGVQVVAGSNPVAPTIEAPGVMEKSTAPGALFCAKSEARTKPPHHPRVPHSARGRRTPATVCALVERGEIEHVRISNALRISPTALAAYVRREDV